MKCIVMFSGGLDSTIAVHFLKRLGFDVLALHFVLPFYSGLGLGHLSVTKAAEALGVPLRIEEEGEEYLAMFKTRQYGFGKNANPCLDCRIHRLEKAGRIMAGEAVSFIATGEVVGQRPMSQRRDCLDIIDKKSGLAGLLLRPLCGRLLNPTIPEKQGWVRREDLLDWRGRGRKDQMAYAKRFGLSYPMPGGGCLLTHVRTAERFMDLQKHSPEFSLIDFKLIAYGRHFRINPAAKLIIGRNDGENGILIKLTRPDDTTLIMKDVLGPYGLICGTVSDDEVRMACSIFCKYSRMRNAETAHVTMVRAAVETVVSVTPLTEEECERFRV